MTVLILGARGKIAQHVAAGLETTDIPVRRAGRAGSKPLPDGVIEYDPADPGPVLDGITRVFLYADPSHAPAFVTAAESAGVAQVVLLSSSASQDGNADAASDPHGAAEKILATGAFATTFLQPGAFMTNALYWSYPIKATGEVRMPYLDAEEAPIHERDIADVAVEVLRAGPGGPHDGQSYELAGPESMTRGRQVELVAEITGVPAKPVELTPEEGRAALAKAFGDGPLLDSLMSYWASRVGIPYPTNDRIEQLTGHPARTFADWLTEHAASFV